MMGRVIRFTMGAAPWGDLPGREIALPLLRSLPGLRPFCLPGMEHFVQKGVLEDLLRDVCTQFVPVFEACCQDLSPVSGAAKLPDRIASIEQRNRRRVIQVEKDLGRDHAVEGDLFCRRSGDPLPELPNKRLLRTQGFNGGLLNAKEASHENRRADRGRCEPVVRSGQAGQHASAPLRKDLGNHGEKAQAQGESSEIVRWDKVETRCKGGPEGRTQYLDDGKEEQESGLEPKAQTLQALFP